MNLDRDGMDHDIISRESPLDLEGNYKKVRGGALLFINNWTIFLRGRKVALEEGCQIPHTVVIAVRH
jgi:hypothetical protein